MAKKKTEKIAKSVMLLKFPTMLHDTMKKVSKLQEKTVSEIYITAVEKYLFGEEIT